MAHSRDDDDALGGELDDEDPGSDGTAESSVTVWCPYCGEPNDVTLDPGSGVEQEYEEDCQVCCRQWMVHVQYDRRGEADVEVERLDG